MHGAKPARMQYTALIENMKIAATPAAEPLGGVQANRPNQPVTPAFDAARYRAAYRLYLRPGRQHGGHSPRTARSGRKDNPLPKGKSHSNREVKKPKKDKKPGTPKPGDLFAKSIQTGTEKKT